MPSRTLLLSIRPGFADLIFAGEKSVELRRVRPKVESGDVVLVYVTSPIMALAGAFSVSQVFSGSPDTLWRKVGSHSGLSRFDYREYFDGCETAYGIGVEKSWRFSYPVALDELRQRLPGFLPPQSYWYLPSELLQILIGDTSNRLNHSQLIAALG